VRFDLEPSEVDDDLVVMPVVDGVRLAVLAGRFEEHRGYDPAGGYGGIDVRAFTTDTVAGYLLGHAGPYADREGPGLLRRAWLASRRGRPIRRRLALLACDDCGGQGCWPLTAVVTSSPTEVTWSGFGNPHRPTWDYRGLGPFTFDRAAYGAALEDLTRRLAELDGSSVT